MKVSMASFRRITLLVILGTLIFPVAIAEVAHSQDEPKGWRGLVPLRATRRDVEGLLGAPTIPGSSLYETDDANIFVDYSDGPCEKGWPYGWNVNQDTVVSINVRPKSTVVLADLKLDEKKYRKIPDGHFNDTFHYVNDDNGISIEVDEPRGKVRCFSYGPVVSDLKLQCPDAANRLPVGRGQADSLFKFDEYGDLAPNGEHERLDSVAAALIRQPETEAYIIAYAGLVAQAGEAAARASCARDYLIKKHRIAADRIRAIDGGYREARVVEVYVEPKDGDVPLPRPSVRPSKVKITQEKPALRCASSRSQD